MYAPVQEPAGQRGRANRVSAPARPAGSLPTIPNQIVRLSRDFYIKWLVDRNIAPHVPVWDKSTRPDGTFSRADFVFDQERNIYVCPGGVELTSTGNIDQGHIVYYRAPARATARAVH